MAISDAAKRGSRGRRRKFSKELVDKACDLRCKGWRICDIAHVLGVSRAWVSRATTDLSRDRALIAKRARHMLSIGMCHSKIAAELGIQESAVRWYAAHKPVDPQVKRDRELSEFRRRIQNGTLKPSNRSAK